MPLLVGGIVLCFFTFLFRHNTKTWVHWQAPNFAFQQKVLRPPSTEFWSNLLAPFLGTQLEDLTLVAVNRAYGGDCQ